VRPAEIEAFDGKLAQRIQALNAQIENHTLQLANLRRTAPAETAQRFQETFAKAAEEDDARLQKAREAMLEEAQQTNVEVPEVERLDEIQSTWQHGTESLFTLKSGLGGTVATMERAQRAVDFLDER
jgi:kinetochor protein Mis14/NSL1